jgi:anti-anti-sigma factor
MSDSDRVFETEFADGVLVVIPVDQHIGFRERQLQEQTNRVMQAIEQENVRSVVVDAANLPFLASRVIGAFIQIWETTRERGGRFVLCNLSDDALQGLIVTRLDTRWPTYASRNEALAAVTG